MLMFGKPLAENWPENTFRISKQDGKSKTQHIKKLLEEVRKYDRLVPTADFRSLLFSRGVLIVEGISDRIAIELIDRYSSSIKEGPSLTNNEWSILESGGVEGIKTLISFANKLGLKWLVLTDSDAITSVRRKSLPAAFQALKDSGITLVGETEIMALVHKLKTIGVETSLMQALRSLREIALNYNIFSFTKDLDNALGLNESIRTRKPTNVATAMLTQIRNQRYSSDVLELLKFLHSKVT